MVKFKKFLLDSPDKRKKGRWVLHILDFNFNVFG